MYYYVVPRPTLPTSIADYDEKTVSRWYAVKNFQFYGTWTVIKFNFFHSGQLYQSVYSFIFSGVHLLVTGFYYFDGCLVLVSCTPQQFLLLCWPQEVKRWHLTTFVEGNVVSLRRLKDLFDFTCMIAEKSFQKTQKWSSVYSKNGAKTFRRLRHRQLSRNWRWRRRRNVVSCLKPKRFSGPESDCSWLLVNLESFSFVFCFFFFKSFADISGNSSVVTQRVRCIFCLNRTVIRSTPELLLV